MKVQTAPVHLGDAIVPRSEGKRVLDFWDSLVRDATKNDAHDATSETIHLVQLVRFLDEALAMPDPRLREYIEALRDKCQSRWSDTIVAACESSTR